MVRQAFIFCCGALIGVLGLLVLQEYVGSSDDDDSSRRAPSASQKEPDGDRIATLTEKCMKEMSPAVLYPGKKYTDEQKADRYNAFVAGCVAASELTLSGTATSSAKEDGSVTIGPPD